jgi:hypothetical protein
MSQFFPVIQSGKHITNLITNKKIIYISPGGFKGAYMLGVAAYIKDNYDTSNYLFYGASAGAWISLLMTSNKNHHEIVDKIGILKPDFDKKNVKKIIDKNLKKVLLENYNTEDFDLNRLFIGVSHYNKNSLFKSAMYTDFTGLQDAIDCCIASSHIPFITGGFVKYYDNLLTFDGGFAKVFNFPNIQPVLCITPDMWEIEKKKRIELSFNSKIILNLKILYDTTSLINGHKYNLSELYLQGYTNSHENKHILDEIFYDGDTI